MKSIFITILLILFVSCAKKEDADINKIVSDAYPNVSIESLKKIDEKGNIKSFRHIYIFLLKNIIKAV